MQDLAVTIDGVTRPLPEPFFVIATQNPIESQGTYPLPEAQLDRFLFKLDVRHPTAAVERPDPAEPRPRLQRRAPRARRAPARRHRGGARRRCASRSDAIRVDDGIIDYIADIVGRSRAHRSVYLGASPRASIGLLAAARAMAAAEGRDFVVPDDVKALAPAVLRHRLILHPDAEIEGVSADDCVEDILREAKVPKTAG